MALEIHDIAQITRRETESAESGSMRSCEYVRVHWDDNFKRKKCLGSISACIAAFPKWLHGVWPRLFAPEPSRGTERRLATPQTVPKSGRNAESLASSPCRQDSLIAITYRVRDCRWDPRPRNCSRRSLVGKRDGLTPCRHSGNAAAAEAEILA